MSAGLIDLALNHSKQSLITINFCAYASFRVPIVGPPSPGPQKGSDPFTAKVLFHKARWGSLPVYLTKWGSTDPAKDQLYILSHGLPKLRTLEILKDHGLGPEIVMRLPAIPNSMPSLRRVSLQCSFPWEHSLPFLGGLEYLVIRYARSSPAGRVLVPFGQLCRILEASPKLNSFELCGFGLERDKLAKNSREIRMMNLESLKLAALDSEDMDFLSKYIVAPKAFNFDLMDWDGPSMRRFSRHIGRLDEDMFPASILFEEGTHFAVRMEGMKSLKITWGSRLDSMFFSGWTETQHNLVKHINCTAFSASDAQLINASFSNVESLEGPTDALRAVLTSVNIVRPADDSPASPIFPGVIRITLTGVHGANLHPLLSMLRHRSGLTVQGVALRLQLLTIVNHKYSLRALPENVLKAWRPHVDVIH